MACYILTRYRSCRENGSISKEVKDYLVENFFVPPEEYDVVSGYRADNSNFTYAKGFVSNGISLISRFVTGIFIQ